MKKLLVVSVMGLFAVACVPHDEDVVEFEPVNEPAYWQPVQAQPVVARPVQQPAPVRVQAQPAQPQQTWWNENKKKHVVRVKVPTCPCTDPNEPCPQCYDK